MEIDGPATGWFQTSNGLRYPYITYAIGKIGDQDANGDLVLALAKHVDKMSQQGIIVWRRRPEFVWQSDQEVNPEWDQLATPAHWRLTYRCVVIPFGEFENSFDVPSKAEGEIYQFI